MDNAPEINRTPPRNLEAEQAVLGAAFLAKDAIVEAMEYVQPEDFYTRAHQILFSTMIKLNDRDVPIDVVSLKNELDRENQTENVGGVEYLAKLAGAVPTAADVVYYAKIVKEKATSRRLIDTATKIVSKTYDDTEDLTDLLDDAER